MVVNDILGVLSSIFGWTYFSAWMVASYPQTILNYRRKHVGGLSIDFVVINVLGYASYVVYTVVFLISDDVQEEYRRRHDGHPNVVRVNDAGFAIHSALLAGIVLLQTFYYPRNPGQRLSTLNRLMIFIFVLLLIGNMVTVFVLKTVHLIDFLYLLSYYKLYVTVAKYAHQVWENYSRKSTIGWSINAMLLDAVGGILSLVQLFLDAARADDWTAITGNFGKLALSSVSIAFDIIFIVQHYILYTDRAGEHVQGATSKSPPLPRKTASPSLVPVGLEAGEETPLLPQHVDTQ